MIDLAKRIIGKADIPDDNKVHWEYPKEFGGDIKIVIQMGKNTRVEPGDTLTVQFDLLAAVGPRYGRNDL